MKYIMIAFFCLFCLQQGIAKSYEVKTQDEFNQAATHLKPGDEIVIADGSYTGWSVAVTANGTSLKPITICSRGSAVFTGEANKTVMSISGNNIIVKDLRFEGCSLIKEGGSDVFLLQLSASANCRITGCSFIKNTVSKQFMPIIVISGNSKDNRIDHSRFEGNINNQDIQVRVAADDVSTYTLIDHNTFMNKDSVTWKGNNGGECVQIGQDPILLGNKQAFATVRNNHFVRCNGEPEVISNKASDNKYIANNFEDCRGELVMRGGHDCLIDSNNFIGGIGGMRINGTGHTVTRNTFKNLPIAIRLMYGMASGRTETGFYIAASECTIENNIIANCRTQIQVDGGKNTDWSGKFDTKRYPSRTMQDVAPFNNTIRNNSIVNN